MQDWLLLVAEVLVVTITRLAGAAYLTGLPARHSKVGARARRRTAVGADSEQSDYLLERRDLGTQPAGLRADGVQGSGDGEGEQLGVGQPWWVGPVRTGCPGGHRC